MNFSRKYWTSRQRVLAFAVVPAVLLGFGAFRLTRSAPTLATAQVQRKEFVDYLEIKGDVKARRSMVIAAPYNAGDLQILSLAANGAKVKKGDVVVEFDATTVKQKLAQDQSAVKSAEAEVAQSRAAARLKEEQDLTDVMTAKFDVQKTRMDASKQEILSTIEGEQAKLKVADAEQKEKEAEAKLKADRASAASDVTGKQQKREQAAYQVKLDETSLNFLILRAPIDGLVVLQNHWQPQGGPTPFRAGDRAWPGADIMELPDTTSLKIVARVEEAERGQLKVDQSAKVGIDALPDRSFDAHVATISPTASLDFSAGWPVPRNFSVELSLAEIDPRLTPGMAATVRVAVASIPDGVVIPTEALFRKSGRTIIYLKKGSKFEETVVDVARRSGDEVLVAKGLQPGEQVALKDPTVGK